eukprot:TRINITY_DN2965_c0_g1_i1.p1 TRINITY_DN2965_c0_g1~~TRINITY_DN2965_c0_g1_i1.p1  ORF type:complete len:764 (+),score=83.55 TRINITY_DN2965_c0_g1_i1:52-2343(+)
MWAAMGRRGPWQAALALLMLLHQCTGECDWDVRDGCEWGADGCSCEVTRDCFACKTTKFWEALSCADCAALDGYWCARESLCMETVVADTVFKAEGIAAHCEGAWTKTCPTLDGFKHPAKLFEAQNWVYDLANVKPAWAAGLSGRGVVVQVNDDGVASDHPDFAGRFRKDLSCSAYEPADSVLDTHGTTCAAIAVGAADGACSAGIAPRAELSSCTVLSSKNITVGSDATAKEIEDSAYLGMHLDNVSVSSNSYISRTCTKKTFGGWKRADESTTAVCPFNPDPSATFTPCNWGPCEWGASFDRGSESCQEMMRWYCSNNYETEPACEDFLDMFIDPCYYNTMSNATKTTLKRAVTEGRGGKGIIVVYAAGNEHTDGEHVGMTAPQNSRLTISVGAVGKNGSHASYSSPGAALFITAPGGDHDFIRNHVTAWSDPSRLCYSAGVGTSYAAPVVSGVVALMLEANPELHWRDVQAVLQASANTSAAAMQDGAWTNNSVGVRHHMEYGFGLVDAGKAVEMAKRWRSWGPERLLTAGTGNTLSVTIPDNGVDGVTSSVNVSESVVVESVVVYLNMTHPTRGDVDVLLESPGGTISLLHPGRRPEYTRVETWKLLSVVHWGEQSAGEWKLRLVDRVKGERVQCVDKPFSTDIQGTAVTCGFLLITELCKDGGEGPRFTELRESGDIEMDFHTFFKTVADDAGRTPLTECCACGGGAVPDEIAETLNGWSLLVYGHTKMLPDVTDGASSSAAVSVAALLCGFAATLFH